MSDNHLDRFFRAKLDHLDEAPDPAMWLQAKALIDAYSRKKKKDRWLFFLFLGILGMIHVGLVYKISSELIKPRAGKTEIPLARSEQIPDVKNLERVEEQDIPSNDFDQDLAEDPSGRTANFNHIYSDEASKAAKPSASSVDHFKGRQVIADRSQPSRNLDITSKPGSSSSEKVRSGAEQAETPSVPQTSSDANEIHSGEDGTEMGPPIDVVTFVEKRPATWLIWKYGLDQGSRPYPRESLMEDIRYRETRLGWTGTILLNPATHTSPVQGFTVGFAGEYHLSRDWYVGARPSVQMRLNQDGFSKFQTLTTFAFEAVSTTYGLKASSLQMVSLPVYLGWRRGIHMVDIGGSADLVVAARGRLQQLDVNGQEVREVENLNTGWIETDAMNSVSVNVFAGYKLRLTDRLYSGMAFYYFPGRLYPGLPNNLNQELTSRWHLGLQATYYLQ